MLSSSIALLFSGPALAGSISTAGVMAGPDSGAATPNVAAVALNPAAIAPMTGFSALLDAQASFIGIEATADRNGGIDPNTGQPYEPANASATVPNAVVGFVWNVVPDRLSFGFVATDPFVGGGDYSAGGDTGQQRYHIIETTLLTAALTPAVGVTVVDGLHVGAGASYVIDIIDVTLASDPLGTEGIATEELAQDVPDNPYALDTKLSGTGSGSHWGWNAGVFFDKYEKLQLGVSYASAGQYNVSGEGSVEVPATLSSVGDVTVPALVSVEMPLPAIARFYGASQLNEKLWLGAGVEWQLWNQCCGGEDADIIIGLTNEAGNAVGPDDGVAIEIATEQYSPRRLWNAMNFATMAGYQASEKLWLGGRLGYNQNAVPDYAVTPSNLDFQNIAVMAGGRYKVGSVTLGLAYSKFLLFTREVTDSAWNLQDGNERFSPELPYKTNANGTYSGHVDTLGVRVGVDI